MVYLRGATEKDMDLLYEWANDPDVRNNSFSSDLIMYEDHKKWFRRIMSDDSVIQYILMDDEVPVGQIRLNVNDSEAEIGYSISASYRGQGYGHIILELAMQEVRTQNPCIRRLVAKVKPDNLASRGLFEKEGYKMKYAYYTMDV